jgi:hypothetical protein
VTFILSGHLGFAKVKNAVSAIVRRVGLAPKPTEPQTFRRIRDVPLTEFRAATEWLSKVMVPRNDLS